MLAYVYGVVPISLCRGGGCGVSTANGKGVKIEFDEDDGPITGNVVTGETHAAHWLTPSSASTLSAGLFPCAFQSLCSSSSQWLTPGEP